MAVRKHILMNHVYVCAFSDQWLIFWRTHEPSPGSCWHHHCVRADAAQVNVHETQKRQTFQAQDKLFCTQRSSQHHRSASSCLFCSSLSNLASSMHLGAETKQGWVGYKIVDTLPVNEILTDTWDVPSSPMLFVEPRNAERRRAASTWRFQWELQTEQVEEEESFEHFTLCKAAHAFGFRAVLFTNDEHNGPLFNLFHRYISTSCHETSTYLHICVQLKISVWERKGFLQVESFGRALVLSVEHIFLRFLEVLVLHFHSSFSQRQQPRLRTDRLKQVRREVSQSKHAV